MNSLGEALGTYLKQFRFTKGETQDWLANFLGLSRKTINRWEKNGAGTATLDQVEEISKKFQMPIKNLLGLDIREAYIERVELRKDQWDTLTKQLQLVSSSKSPIPQDILEGLSNLSHDKQDMAWGVIRSMISSLGGQKKREDEVS